MEARRQVRIPDEEEEARRRRAEETAQAIEELRLEMDRILVAARHRIALAKVFGLQDRLGDALPSGDGFGAVAAGGTTAERLPVLG